MQFHDTQRRARTTLPASLILILVFTSCASPRTQTQKQSAQPKPTATPQTPAQATSIKPGSPSEAVLSFYRALRERRLREAFPRSVYKPAIDSLSAEEFEELRPEFEKLGEGVRERIEISGEQISGDRATVFARVSKDPGAPTESIDLIRVGDAWLVGTREDYDAMRRNGKDIFFKARLETHHEEVRKVIFKIVTAEAAYAAQNGGRYSDLSMLMQTETAARVALREDVDALQTMGYRLTLSVASGGGKNYKINAEPARYGRSGRLSFYADAGGMQEKDTGGKSYNPPPIKKKS